jgi:hypothetical protein
MVFQGRLVIGKTPASAPDGSQRQFYTIGISAVPITTAVVLVGF